MAAAGPWCWRRRAARCGLCRRPEDPKGAAQFRVGLESAGAPGPAPGRVEPGESPGGSLRPTAARIMGPPKLPMGADGAARIPVPVGEPSEKGACNLQGDRPPP